MHVLVGGTPANDESSTDVWQYRQSIPSPCTWCRWLNGTGCGRAAYCPVTKEERPTTEATSPSPVRPNTRPKTLALATTFMPGWKICAITNGPTPRGMLVAARLPLEPTN